MLIFICFTCCSFFIFFFNDSATSEIYTLSLHDALPILPATLNAIAAQRAALLMQDYAGGMVVPGMVDKDRKSTRLNSSHRCISYAVFCLKKKKKKNKKNNKSKIIQQTQQYYKNK